MILKKIVQVVKANIETSNANSQARAEKEAWEFTKQHFANKIESSQKNLKR